MPATTSFAALPTRPLPLIGIGTVRHRRTRPQVHAFAYDSWFLLLPMRQLREKPEPALRRNRRGWASFHDADHGDGGPDALAWAERRLQEAGVHADGEVWLHTLPRILGHAFKPVSFWYAHRADGTLAAVLAEVNNTFGERHTYVLHGPQLAWGRPIEAAKRLHVSPFAQVQGKYRFAFLRTDLANLGEPDGTAPTAGSGSTAPLAPQARPPRTVVRIDYDDGQGVLLQTSVSGTLQRLSAASLRAALWRMPLLSLGVVARIHLQALRLAWRRVPFFGRDGRPPAQPDLSPQPATVMTPTAPGPAAQAATGHPTSARFTSPSADPEFRPCPEAP